MKGLKKGKVRYLILALALCLVTASGVGIYTLMENKDKADAAVSTTEVTFNAATDMVTVQLKTGTTYTPYKFYTTANASKKVPTPNNWTPTDSGKVDMSYFTTVKTLYFANSTSPALEDIVTVNVPAAPVLAKAAYTPNNSGDVATMFSFQTNLNVDVTTTVKEKAKTVTKAVKVDVPLSRMQYRINDSGAWTDFVKTVDKSGNVTAYNMTTAILEGVQKEGGTIYVRVKAGTAGVTSADNIYTVTDSTTTIGSVITAPAADTLKADSVVSKNNVVRAGVSKVLKIAKRPAAPAVSIDYVNHCVTLKSTQQYAETTGYAAPTSWTEVAKPDTAKPTATSWTNKIYFGTNGEVTAANQTLVVKNVGSAKALDSHLTYVDISAAKTSDFVGTASIQGAYEGAATLVVKAAEAKKGIAYQYAIVDLNSDDFNDLITYNATAKAALFNYANTKVKWSNVSTDATGTAKATLAWAKVKGKQVIVRKAAVAAAKEFSSKVIIFDAPKGTNTAPATLADATPMNCWTELAQKDMTAALKFAANGGISYTQAKTLCANIDNPVYTVTPKTITFNIIGCKTAPKAADTLYDLGIKVGKTVYSVSDAVTAKVVANNVQVTIDTTKLTSNGVALPENNATNMTITVPEGYVTDATGFANEAKTMTITFDNKAPLMTTKNPVATLSKDKSSATLKLVFDSPLALNDVALVKNGTLEAKNFTFKNSAGKIVILTPGEVKCVAPTTIEIPLTLGTDKTAATTEMVTVTLPAFTDIAGNALATKTFEIKNPFYTPAS